MSNDAITPPLGPLTTEHHQMNEKNLGGSIDPDDPLLIAQTLTYVTDNGSVVMSYSSAPFSFAFKFRFLLLESLFVVGLIFLAPIGAHGTILVVSIGNLLAVAWFWYNSVRSVEVTADGALRFWIGNVEVDVPFDKIVEMRRIVDECAIWSCSLIPHRGYLTTPSDGVAIITSVPSTPFFMWPRSAGRPERRLGPFACPRLKILFSPNGGGMNFLREVEDEMRAGSGGRRADGAARNGGMIQPPAYDTKSARNGVGEFYDV
eukprot:CAMPEP_0203711684 /NCGR_PEP_ID=MMETSP0091-20130426/69642_1 /ASSEMBLY_ACC=CAM_ASM_001089 /TAXON_ID=426623 /ORGANISM="Chaetoceros affinis, Strain CCMP159" /LENGTH=260 /DNA_ID=CAMNT_0050589625 /DNA_START=113 /DNA_END=895 /DNA_ORIENTATION=-